MGEQGAESIQQAPSKNKEDVKTSNTQERHEGRLSNLLTAIRRRFEGTNPEAKPAQPDLKELTGEQREKLTAEQDAKLTDKERERLIGEQQAINAKADADTKLLREQTLGDYTIEDRRMIAKQDEIKAAAQKRIQSLTLGIKPLPTTEQQVSNTPTITTLEIPKTQPTEEIPEEQKAA